MSGFDFYHGYSKPTDAVVYVCNLKLIGKANIGTLVCLSAQLLEARIARFRAGRSSPAPSSLALLVPARMHETYRLFSGMRLSGSVGQSHRLAHRDKEFVKPVQCIRSCTLVFLTGALRIHARASAPQVGGDPYTGRLTRLGVVGVVPVSMALLDNGDATYVMTYTATVAGRYALVVELAGVPLAAVPTNFTVLVAAGSVFPPACILQPNSTQLTTAVAGRVVEFRITVGERAPSVTQYPAVMFREVVPAHAAQLGQSGSVDVSAYQKGWMDAHVVASTHELYQAKPHAYTCTPLPYPQRFDDHCWSLLGMGSQKAHTPGARCGVPLACYQFRVSGPC